MTGHDVEFTGLTISRCRDGKIEEEWEIVDVMSLLAQIARAGPGPDDVVGHAAGEQERLLSDQRDLAPTLLPHRHRVAPALTLGGTLVDDGA